MKKDQPPDCLDADIGTDAVQLFSEKAHIDLHMILHRIGVISPHPGQDYFL